MQLKYCLTLVLTTLVSACAPNDFTSTLNPIARHEVESATTGIQVNIQNLIPVVPSANGVPTVFHINAQICNWDLTDDTQPTDRHRDPDEPLRPGSLSQCHHFRGTIHSGEQEYFLIPAEVAERIFRQSAGHARLLFQSSAQGTSYYQGCSAAVTLSPHFHASKQVLDVQVTRQNRTWGYECIVQ